MGLSLSYALAITGLLNSLLTSFAETEQEMVAVERILEYIDLEPQVVCCALCLIPASLPLLFYILCLHYENCSAALAFSKVRVLLLTPVLCLKSFD